MNCYKFTKQYKINSLTEQKICRKYKLSVFVVWEKQINAVKFWGEINMYIEIDING